MTVSTTSNKVSFSANGSTTVFAYNFKIFADADLTVIIRAADGTETTKTLTTHYTVSGAGSASGGNVTFTSGNTPASGETVVIQRKLTLTQGTDYVANDPFPAESHEDALDRLTFITQQIQEEVDRSIKASVTNTISGATFTLSASDRANKVFAFDSSGDLAVTQEIGTFRGNWAAGTAYNQRDLVKDTSTNNIFIVNAAHTSSGSQPLTTNANSAKYDLIVDAATATTQAATATTQATASATSATNSANSATASANSATASANSATASAASATSAANTLTTFQGQYHGAASSDPTSNLDAGDLYFNTSTGIKVYTGSAWEDVKPTSSEQTNINAVASNASNINALAATDVLADMALLGTADVVADMALLANADVISDMNTLAVTDVINDINTLATSDIVSDLNTLATSDIVSDLNTLATSDIVSDINTLATSDIVSDLNTLATSDFVSDLNTMATTSNVNNLSTVAGAVANVNTVATNLSSINDFADKYRIGSSNPTSNNDEGDLFYNTSTNKLLVFDGSSFVEGVTAGSGFATLSGASFTGAVDVDAALTANSLALDNGSNDWTITISSNNLIFSYAGTARMKLDSSGNLTVTGDVTSEGTI